MTYFNPITTTCRCGCGFDITPEARAKFDELRIAMGIPLVVSGGARCGDHNKAVGGAPSSRHMYGDALDISCPGKERWRLVYTAMKLGAKGIGISKAFIHIDWRTGTGDIWEY
jgi:uncharacterized protein YcbK (DUF882 family)